MIGLISPNLSSVNNWRDLTKVSPAVSTWLHSLESMQGLRLSAIICLPGWQDRPGNNQILFEANMRLLVPAPDPEDVAIERSTPPTPVEEPNDGVSLTSIAHPERGFVFATPPRADRSDRDYMRRFVSNDMYERMSHGQREHLISLIRAPGTGATSSARQYVESLRRRFYEPEAEATVDAQRRLSRVNEIVAIVGEGNREFVHALPLRDIESLIRLSQLYLLSTGQEAVEAGARFREYWRMLQEVRMPRSLEDVWVERTTRETPPRTTAGVPTQRVTRPPTSGPPTGGRTVGGSIPFSDIFAPSRRSRDP